MLTVLLSDLNLYAYHFAIKILIYLSIASYLICPLAYHECTRISIFRFVSKFCICPYCNSTIPSISLVLLVYKCICSHKCWCLLIIDYGYNSLLYVPQFNFLLVLTHVLYLSLLVCVSSPTWYFTRYICNAGTYKVARIELFTEHLILMFLFMYRLLIVLNWFTCNWTNQIS